MLPNLRLCSPAIAWPPAVPCHERARSEYTKRPLCPACPYVNRAPDVQVSRHIQRPVLSRRDRFESYRGSYLCGTDLQEYAGSGAGEGACGGLVSRSTQAKAMINTRSWRGLAWMLRRLGGSSCYAQCAAGSVGRVQLACGASCGVRCSSPPSLWNPVSELQFELRPGLPSARMDLTYCDSCRDDGSLCRMPEQELPYAAGCSYSPGLREPGGREVLNPCP